MSEQQETFATDSLTIEQRKAMNLTEKLAAMIGEVGWIPKRGRNNSQNYNFVLESDVADAARKLQSKYGVYFHFGITPGTYIADTIETKKSDYESGAVKVTTRFRVVFEGIVVIHDADSPEKITSSFPGYGHDADDKCANKALTAFRKYATLAVLQVSTGDDPDAHGDNDKNNGANNNKQQGRNSKNALNSAQNPPNNKAALEKEQNERKNLMHKLARIATDWDGKAEKLTADQQRAAKTWLAQTLTRVIEGFDPKNSLPSLSTVDLRFLRAAINTHDKETRTNGNTR